PRLREDAARGGACLRPLGSPGAAATPAPAGAIHRKGPARVQSRRRRRRPPGARAVPTRGKAPPPRLPPPAAPPLEGRNGGGREEESGRRGVVRGGGGAGTGPRGGPGRGEGGGASSTRGAGPAPLRAPARLTQPLEPILIPKLWIWLRGGGATSATEETLGTRGHGRRPPGLPRTDPKEGGRRRGRADGGTSGRHGRGAPPGRSGAEWDAATRSADASWRRGEETAEGRRARWGAPPDTRPLREPPWPVGRLTRRQPGARGTRRGGATTQGRARGGGRCRSVPRVTAGARVPGARPRARDWASARASPTGRGRGGVTFRDPGALGTGEGPAGRTRTDRRRGRAATDGGPHRALRDPSRPCPGHPEAACGAREPPKSTWRPRAPRLELSRSSLPRLVGGAPTPGSAAPPPPPRASDDRAPGRVGGGAPCVPLGGQRALDGP
uniref:Uncharacterized protein n=1 Tax=Equus caballus TaxID=9796 RepID=A0A9L0RAA2_HORSE